MLDKSKVPLQPTSGSISRYFSGGAHKRVIYQAQSVFPSGGANLRSWSPLDEPGHSIQYKVGKVQDGKTTMDITIHTPAWPPYWKFRSKVTPSFR